MVWQKEIVGREAKAETAKESLELKISLCYIQHTYTSISYASVFMLWLCCLCVFINLLGCWLGFWYFFFALLTQIFHSLVKISKQMWVMLDRFADCSSYMFFGGKSKLKLAMSKTTNTFHNFEDPFTLCSFDLRLKLMIHVIWSYVHKINLNLVRHQVSMLGAWFLNIYFALLNHLIQYKH